MQDTETNTTQTVANTGVEKIAAALAKVQGAMPPLEKNREVVVKTKTGGSYKFKYATLDHIIEHVKKPLADNGLSFTQPLEGVGGKYQLVTRLMHDSGQVIESVMPLLVDGSGNQAFGSALTYMRRYALTALLGLAADDDDDGNAGDGHTATPTPKPRKQQSKKHTQKPQEQPDGYEAVLSEGLTYIGKVNTATDADAMLASIAEWGEKDKLVGTSELDLKKALNERVKVQGLEYNTIAKKFYSKE